MFGACWDDDDNTFESAPPKVRHEGMLLLAAVSPYTHTPQGAPVTEVPVQPTPV